MASGFYIINIVIQGELRQNQIISVKEKASLVTIPTQIKTLWKARMLQVLLLLDTTSITVIVNTNIQPQVQ